MSPPPAAQAVLRLLGALVLALSSITVAASWATAGDVDPQQGSGGQSSTGQTSGGDTSGGDTTGGDTTGGDADGADDAAE